jgi:hypothetical protein
MASILWHQSWTGIKWQHQSEGINPGQALNINPANINPGQALNINPHQSWTGIKWEISYDTIRHVLSRR